VYPDTTDLLETDEYIETNGGERNEGSNAGIDADPSQEQKRDPEEEYFRLSVLSLKLQYDEKDPNFAVRVSAKKLYKRCKKDGIPFASWYNWIEL
jgi:hypothetical protein